MRTELCVALALVAVAAPLVGAQQSADSIPPETIALGKRIFEGKVGGAICFTCHAPNAKGTPGLGPNLTDTTWLHGDGSLTFIESVVKSGVPKAKQSAAPMPPMGGGKLTAEQLRAVAAYVYSLSHSR